MDRDTLVRHERERADRIAAAAARLHHQEEEQEVVLGEV